MMTQRRRALPVWIAGVALLVVVCRPAASQVVVDAAADTETVLAADDRRIAAMTTVDTTALEAVLDDDLRYAHSNGTVDTKQSFIDLVESGRTKYLEYRPAERHVTFPAEGIALVAGRAELVVENDTGRNAITLSYLAVWREVQGEWKLRAWQSARLREP